MTTLPSPSPGPGAVRPRATMRDVAALAGVSLKTVSRVVNGEAGVSPRLVERVERAAEQLDFRPNLGARSLRRSDGKTATIGVILENLANPFSGSVHRAIEDVARPRGVAVLAGSIDETAERERELVAAFSSRRVDGLIMMPTGLDHSYLLLERRAGVGLVFVDRPPRALSADVVLADNRAGAAAGTAHLVSHGHRRIGFLGDLSTILTEQERCAGYQDALRDAGLPADPSLVIRELDTMAAAEAATLALLEREDPPTALFSAQNLITIGAIRALRRLGRQHSVAVVGVDDFLLADLLEPAVTVVAQDPIAIGRLAAQQLFRRIDGDRSPFVQEVVPTVLIPRGSGELRPA